MRPVALQWLSKLKTVRRQCYIVVSPDPRIRGFYHEKGSYYHLKVGTGPGIERDGYDDMTDSYAFSYNYPRRFSPRGSHPFDLLESSPWTFVVDDGRKNSNGQGVRQVLLDIIEKFPQYRLESQNGICQAAAELDRKLNEVARFEDEHWYPEWEPINEV